MFKLTIHDRKGTQLNEGDIVKVSNGRRFEFYARVTFLEKEMAIAPFHTFSFHSFEKVEEIPATAVKSTEDRYDIWFVQDREEQETDNEADKYNNYLMEWRHCECFLNNRLWRIEREQPLHIQDNVGRSEELICPFCKSKNVTEWSDGEATCYDCKKQLLAPVR